MKIKNLLFVFTILTLWYSTTALYPGGPPLASSGAPISAATNEKTCVQSGCHNGGTQTGTVTFTGLPAEVEAGKAYTITANCASTAAKTGGFQLTVIDGNYAKSGNLAAGTNQAIALQGTRQYVTQSKLGTYASGKLAYTFTWTAPAASANKDISFHAAFLLANGNGNDNGDAIATGNTKVTFKTSATNDPALEKAMTVFPNPTTNQLNINLLEVENANFILSNEVGQAVISSKLESKNNFDVSNLARGIYFAKIQVGAKQAVKKVVLQ